MLEYLATLRARPTACSGPKTRRPRGAGCCRARSACVAAWRDPLRQRLAVDPRSPATSRSIAQRDDALRVNCAETDETAEPFVLNLPSRPHQSWQRVWGHGRCGRRSRASSAAGSPGENGGRMPPAAAGELAAGSVQAPANPPTASKPGACPDQVRAICRSGGPRDPTASLLTRIRLSYGHALTELRRFRLGQALATRNHGRHAQRPREPAAAEEVASAAPRFRGANVVQRSLPAPVPRSLGVYYFSFLFRRCGQRQVAGPLVTLQCPADRSQKQLALGVAQPPRGVCESRRRRRRIPCP